MGLQQVYKNFFKNSFINNDRQRLIDCLNKMKLIEKEVNSIKSDDILTVNILSTVDHHCKKIIKNIIKLI
jgi:predicted YcjX-like family ATPase